MLTGRDRKLLSFVQEVGAITADQAARLQFAALQYPLRMAQKRLAALAEQCGLKRLRDPFSGRFVYTTRPRAQLQHRIVLAEFRCRLERFGRLIAWETEPTYDDVRPDAYAAVQIGGTVHDFFVEVQLCHLPPDTAKYQRLEEWMAHTQPESGFPLVVVVSDRKWDLPEGFTGLGLDMKGFERLFED